MGCFISTCDRNRFMMDRNFLVILRMPDLSTSVSFQLELASITARNCILCDANTLRTIQQELAAVYGCCV